MFTFTLYCYLLQKGGLTLQLAIGSMSTVLLRMQKSPFISHANIYLDYSIPIWKMCTTFIITQHRIRVGVIFYILRLSRLASLSRIVCVCVYRTHKPVMASVAVLHNHGSWGTSHALLLSNLKNL